jgi:dienelactone hydrolase
MNTFSAILLSSLLSASLFAAVKSEPVEYSAGDTKMQGVVFYDDSIKEPKPAIMVVHDWMGIGGYTQGKAEALAKQGYVTMAVDVYGKGVKPKNTDEASALAGKFKDNRTLLREHMKAAYDKLVSMKNVNPKKVVVMGYCFGGTAALELARAGTPLAGTATFHGGLSNPKPQDASQIQGKVLVMHGADDPFVNKKEVEAFKDEMGKAKVKLEFVSYPKSVHSFTNPEAGNDNSKGAAYNAEADKRSWAKFQKFIKSVL